MKQHSFNICGARLEALSSGVLWWPDTGILTVSDLHLGKSERIARRGGPLVPPYDTLDTLARLEMDIRATNARQIIALGDNFDDQLAASALSEDLTGWLARLQAGRKWIWIAGNHDPGPLHLGGEHMGAFVEGPLTFRHIAQASATGEISGHYHPKHALGRRGTTSRACFIYDDARVILPAYGTFTGGLRSSDKAFRPLFASDARVVMTGEQALVAPLWPK